jgi:hypothetical protein
MFSTLALVRPEQLRRLMARRLMVERPLMSSPPPWNSATAGRDDSDELDVAGDSVGEAEADPDDDAAGCGERENKRFQKPGDDDDCCAIGVCGAGDDANEYELLVDIVAVVDNDDDGEAVSGKASAPDEAGLDAAEENEGEADAAKEKSEEVEAAAAVMKGKEAGKSGRRSASVSDAAWDRSSAVSWKQWLDTAARVRPESVAQRERSSDRTSGSTNLSCRVVSCHACPPMQCCVGQGVPVNCSLRQPTRTAHTPARVVPHRSATHTHTHTHTVPVAAGGVEAGLEVGQQELARGRAEVEQFAAVAPEVVGHGLHAEPPQRPHHR